MERTNPKDILRHAPRHLLSPIDRARIDRLATVVNALPGERVLNIGCGYGFLESTLNTRQRVLGVDINPERIKFACEFNAARADVQFQKLDLFRLSADQATNMGCFDIVIMSEVIEHLEEEDAALSVVRSLLAAPGYFVVSVPNTDRLKNQLYRRRQRGLETRMAPDHVREYTAPSLRRLLSRHGFEVVQIDGICINLPGDRLLHLIIPHHSAVRATLVHYRPDWANYFLAVARHTNPS